jgi:hypothetical protein
MRRMTLILLATIALTTAWSTEGSACWWRRHGRCRHTRVYCCTRPYAVSTVPRYPVAPATAMRPSAAPSQSSTFVSPKTGKSYRILMTMEGDASDLEERRAASITGAPHRPSDGEHFAGSARKTAKTSLAQGSTKEFNSPAELLADILGNETPDSNDAKMRGGLNANSPRAPEEKRNVKVQAFLFATKKESDNDFHLLIGGDPSGSDQTYMTAEISGLPSPDNASTGPITSARSQYKSFFLHGGAGHLQLPGSSYVKFADPVPVTITGSVFFDFDHRIGEVHSGDVRPITVWEIHPISNIEFEPSSNP